MHRSGVLLLLSCFSGSLLSHAYLSAAFRPTGSQILQHCVQLQLPARVCFSQLHMIEYHLNQVIKCHEIRQCLVCTCCYTMLVVPFQKPVLYGTERVITHVCVKLSRL